MCIKASKPKKDWRNSQQLRRLYCSSVEQRGQWNAVLPLSRCRRLLRPLAPGQPCGKGDPECWTGIPRPEAQLWKLEWGSPRADVLAEFGKVATVWEGMNWYFLVRKFLASFASKGFGVILFVEWESCWIPTFWNHPEVLRHPGLRLSIRAFGGRVWQVVLLMRNNGQSTLCSGSSRLADDRPGDVCSQWERPYLAYTEAGSVKLGAFIPPPYSALQKSGLLGLVRETLMSWKAELGCFSEGWTWVLSKELLSIWVWRY